MNQDHGYSKLPSSSSKLRVKPSVKAIKPSVKAIKRAHAEKVSVLAKADCLRL